jgi:membrane protease YdiL (CAAX protease family)
VNRPSRSFLAQVFLSPGEPRLRAGWRIVLQSILLLILLGVISLVVVITAGIIGYDLRALQPLSLLDLIPTAIAMTLSVWIARRLLDHRSFVSLGFRLDRHTLPDMAAGFLIPGVMMAALYLLEICAGWLRFDGWAWEAIPADQVALGLAGGLLAFIVVGYQEELLSRGYCLQNVRDGMGIGWALFLSSAIFALMHLGNPNVTWFSALLGLTLAGVLLAYGWVRTRQLWLSIGVHIGWNFFEGSIFGFPVSGLNVAGLIHQTPTGPVAITGGPFGPEAGLILLPAVALGAGLMWLYTRGHLASSDLV